MRNRVGYGHPGIGQPPTSFYSEKPESERRDSFTHKESERDIHETPNVKIRKKKKMKRHVPNPVPQENSFGNNELDNISLSQISSGNPPQNEGMRVKIAETMMRRQMERESEKSVQLEDSGVYDNNADMLPPRKKLKKKKIKKNNRSNNHGYPEDDNSLHMESTNTVPEPESYVEHSPNVNQVKYDNNERNYEQSHAFDYGKKAGGSI